MNFGVPIYDSTKSEETKPERFEVSIYQNGERIEYYCGRLDFIYRGKDKIEFITEAGTNVLIYPENAVVIIKTILQSSD